MTEVNIAITAAEDHHRSHPDKPDATPVEAVVLHYSDAGLPEQTATEPVASAVVNHGRWLVECPFPGCANAQYASRADHRFYCVACGNGGTHQWVRVAWPKDVAAIEAELAARPDRSTANWTPGETTALLHAENLEHGIRT